MKFVRYVRLVRGVQHQAMIEIRYRKVAIDLQFLGVHQREADAIADGDVIGDFVVVRVHVVDGEPQPFEPVGANDVAVADLDVDAVTSAGDGIAVDERAGVVPDVDAVAAVVWPKIAAISDVVPSNGRELRAVQNNAEEIALKSVVLDGHMVGTLFDIDTAVECLTTGS